MNQHEARIRDYLCQHIELIESGMQLVQKEYKLRSENGAGGSIDILARDAYGHLVIVEIKRSNQAARAALHELTKYVALLKSSQGIQPEKIRALLLSTEWHELAVPFSEYLRSVEVTTEGLLVDADEQGLVRSIAPFAPLSFTSPLKIERVQSIYFFRESGDRDRAIKGLASAADKASIIDFFVIEMDYGGENPQVVHPYGAYFVFSSPVNYEDPDSLQRFVDATGLHWEELYEPGENFLCWLGDFLSIEYDSMEIGYPEKLNSMMIAGWGAHIVYRGGRYADNAVLLTEETLLIQARQIEGGAGHYLYRTSSPRFKSGWCTLKSDLARVVSGCAAWEKTIVGVLKEVESERPDATVSIYMYNPTNIVLTVGKAFAQQDYSFLPSFQLIESSSNRVSVYLGFLAWTGLTPNLLGDELFSRYFGGVESYFMMMNFGELHQRYDVTCSALGLESVVLEVLNPNAPTERTRLLRGGNTREVADNKLRSFERFIAENELFGAALIKTLRSFAVGFV